MVFYKFIRVRRIEIKYQSAMILKRMQWHLSKTLCSFLARDLPWRKVCGKIFEDFINIF